MLHTHNHTYIIPAEPGDVPHGEESHLRPEDAVR